MDKIILFYPSIISIPYRILLAMVKSKKRKNIYRTHTHKRRHRHIVVPSRTSKKVNTLSQLISASINNGAVVGFGAGPQLNNRLGSGSGRIRNLSSYSPTINDNLISLKSSTREKVIGCNLSSAFLLKEPLQIKIGSKCYLYNDPHAREVFLHNLGANKHIDVNVIIPPIQILSNCWFNTMFCAFFISDKGRKFFHYFRQLMIEGRTADRHKIHPRSLRDAFALLNFSIESALLGSSYAYELDTNSIIKLIYDTIQRTYKSGSRNTNPHDEFIVPVDNASNPIRYYEGIIHYLNNTAIQLVVVTLTREKMEKSKSIQDAIQLELYGKHVEKVHYPHIIVVEIFDSHDSPGDSGSIDNRPLEFKLIGGSSGSSESVSALYSLDSCIIRDTYQNHFCALLTCEGSEMGYDGMSFHRLVPLKWKKMINSLTKWTFEGSVDKGRTLEWSFRHGYQMLMYYRI